MQHEYKWVKVNIPNGLSRKEVDSLLEDLLKPYYDQGWKKMDQGNSDMGCITEGGHVGLQREKHS